MTAPLSIASICRGLPNPADPSGGIFVARRLEAMAARSRLTVLQPIPHFPVLAPLPEWAREPEHPWGGLAIEHLPMFYVPRYLKSLDGFWLYRSVRKRLLELKSRAGLDAIDAHFGYPEGVGALRAARELGVPFFVTLRGFEAEYIHKPFIGQQLGFMLRNADGCICVAEFLRDIALENGAAPERTRVIHNAVDRNLFCPGDRDEARRSCGLPPGVPIVLSIGHLTRRKRHHVLISAFKDVLASFPDARLLIVGAETFEPDYPGYLQSCAARLGVRDAVELLGNVESERVVDLLRAADVFALATQREGCCNAVLEALGCGLPVVTTPVGDNSRFINDRVNGYLVPVDDSSRMADALVKALGRRDWDRGRIARELQVGDWNVVAGQVLDFVGERAEERARNGPPVRHRRGKTLPLNRSECGE